MAKKTNTSSNLVTGFLIVAIMILAIGAVYFTKAKLDPVVNQNYRAVFLDNGQVYFGKITKSTAGWIQLTDIYYLRSNREIQGEEAIDSSNEFSLVKLGDELHGPTDAMEINREKVLFLEDLREDSSVVEAILDYQQG